MFRSQLVLQIFQCGTHFRCGLITSRAIFLQGLIDDGFEPSRNFGIQSPYWFWGSSEDRFLKHRPSVSPERPFSRGYFVEDQTEREDIGSRVYSLPAYLFRGHVSSSSENRTCSAESQIDRFDRGCCVCRVVWMLIGVLFNFRMGQLRDAKVQDLGLSVGGEKNITRLNVAVNDAVLMRCLQALEDLRR